MNHVPMRALAPAIRPQKVTRRALAKQQTREKVLGAARQLFIQHGYEGATIRDIARAAGMSTGAVFASFADKSELFDAILNDDLQTLAGPVRDSVERATNTRDRLVGMFATIYRAHASELPLIQAAMAVSWTRTPEADRQRRDAMRPVKALVRDILQRGIDRGELTAKFDLRLISDMIWDLFLAGYRPAAYEGLSPDHQADRLAARIEVILCAIKA